MARGLNKRIKLVLCCAENMISGRALKLGDIIKYKNGKTVEVLNTDAEGRLVLADGLMYANSQHPTLIIDCATLTGSAKMALGNDYHALLSFDQDLSRRALAAASQEGEGMWPLPLAEIHRNMLPSNFADLANISNGDFMPGASTAAAFYPILLMIISKAGCILMPVVLIVRVLMINGQLVRRVWVLKL